jgi:D-alanine-D-alanine ligase
MGVVDPHWYTTFFGDEWLRSIALHIPAERTTREVDFVVEALALEPGARVLDLACGHGRHSLELARRGYRVTGLDLSEPSLAIARQAASQASLDVEFIHGDMREIPFTGEFDAVINLFTAFGYLENEAEDQRVLDSVARALKPEGGFLIDTINALWLFRHFEPHGWQELEDGTLLLEDRRYNPLTGRNEVTWQLIHPDGTRHQQSHSLRLYTLVELATMLCRASLRVEATWGDFEGAEYGLDTRRMIVLARKQAT